MRIAVIGGGPSGLFFCHAMEKIQRETGKAVSVTCFEKASMPGGIWRTAAASSTDASNNSNSTEMYEALWTNGSSHCTEFHDYTYDEHFGKPVTVYMPRQDLLDYLLRRVSQNCPDFFEKYVRCHSAVRKVLYDDSAHQFHVTYETKCETGGGGGASTIITHTDSFDKCVWACGENGQRNLPADLVKVFRDFHGPVLHSSETAHLEDLMRGKTILLVGCNYSAEDLALQAIKLGVEHVYVSARSTSSPIFYTLQWPGDKVTTLAAQMPCKVTENGTCIQFQQVYWTPDGYQTTSDEVETEVRGIDTVFLCTGYRVALDILDEPLRSAGFPKYGSKVDATLDVPKDWKMPENAFSRLIGDVAPSDRVRYLPDYVNPNFYKGILLSNPNMMCISTYGSHTPLMACEVYATLLAKYAAGVLEMPTIAEMKRRNDEYMLKLLGMPYLRWMMDDHFWKAATSLPGYGPLDDEDEYDGDYSEWYAAQDEEFLESFRRLAGDMIEAQYPVSYGTPEQLNEHGMAMYDFGMFDYDNRHDLQPKGDEKPWLTFRDVQETDRYYSPFTGTKAIPLTRRWIDIDLDTEKENVVSPRNDSI